MESRFRSRFHACVSENMINVIPQSDDFICTVITKCYIWFRLIMEIRHVLPSHCVIEVLKWNESTVHGMYSTKSWVNTSIWLKPTNSLNAQGKYFEAWVKASASFWVLFSTMSNNSRRMDVYRCFRLRRIKNTLTMEI